METGGKTRYHRGRYSGQAIKRNIRCTVFVSIGPNSTSCLIFHLFGRKRCKAKDNINWAIHKKGFDELIGNYSLKNLNHRLHFLKGDPAALITDLAAEHAIDLIVMGTICRTGVAGFFIGNTAENVLQQVDCSVLTVKPEGFVSPVKLKAASVSEMP